MKNKIQIDYFEVFIKDSTKKVAINFGEGVNVIFAHSQCGKSLIYDLIKIMLGSKEMFDEYRWENNFLPQEIEAGVYLRLTMKIVSKSEIINFVHEAKVVGFAGICFPERKITLNGNEISIEDETDLLNHFYKKLYNPPKQVSLWRNKDYVRDITVMDYLMLQMISQKNIQQDYLYSSIYENRSVKTKYAIMIETARGKLEDLKKEVEENSQAIHSYSKSSVIDDARKILFPIGKKKIDSETIDNDLATVMDVLIGEKQQLINEKRRILTEERFIENFTTILLEIKDDSRGFDSELYKKIDDLIAIKKASALNSLDTHSLSINQINEKITAINEKLKSLNVVQASEVALYDFFEDAIDKNMNELKNVVEPINKKFEKIRNDLGDEFSKVLASDALNIIKEWKVNNINVENITKIFGQYKESFRMPNKSGLEKCLIVNAAFITTIKLISEFTDMFYMVDSPLETNISQPLDEQVQKSTFSVMVDTYLSTGEQIILFTGKNDVVGNNFSNKNVKLFDINPLDEKNHLLF